MIPPAPAGPQVNIVIAESSRRMAAAHKFLFVSEQRGHLDTPFAPQ